MDKKFIIVTLSVGLANFLIRFAVSPARSNPVSKWLKSANLF